MDLLRAARAIGGLLSIMTLHGLIVLDVVYEEIMLQGETIALLILIIGALLGVDALIEESVKVKIEREKRDR